MSTSAKAVDPSMEEILASIRRIIADDIPTRRETGAGSPLPELGDDELDAAPVEVAGPVIRPIAPSDAAMPSSPDPVPLRPRPREPSLFAEHSVAEPSEATQTVPEQFRPALDLDAVGDVIEAEVAAALRGTSLDADPSRLNGAAVPQAADRSPVPPAPAVRAPEPSLSAPALPPQPSAAFPRSPSPTLGTPTPAPAAGEPTPVRSNFSFGQSSRPSAPLSSSSAASAPPTDRLVSPPTNAAVAASFGTLARTIMTSNSRSLEDVVGELLKPMLRSWLDDNLPTIVERLVKAEIERVSRGGR